MRSIYLSGLLFLFMFAVWHPDDNEKFQINGTAQGTTYHIAYFAKDSIVTRKQVDSILDKIDSSLSLYKPYSLINRFNAAEKEAEVDVHFTRVVRQAKE